MKEIFAAHSNGDDEEPADLYDPANPANPNASGMVNPSALDNPANPYNPGAAFSF